MQVRLLRNGGYSGIEACIGKVFTTTSDTRVKDTLRIPVSYLEREGFINDGSITTSLVFFHWEVEVVNG